jgi:hypothetical protein
MRLPVALTEDLGRAVAGDGAFDFDEEGLRFGQSQTAGQEVAGEGLEVAVAQPAAGNEIAEPLGSRGIQGRG